MSETVHEKPGTDDRTADDRTAEAPDPPAGFTEHVGSFRHWFDSGRWEWSDEVAAMHGYRAGEIEPTTELLRSHKHPDDRAGFDELVEKMLSARVHFSSRHRIVDTRGRIHSVVVISRNFQGLDGRAAGAEGFYLDLGVICDDVDAPSDDEVQERVSEQVQEFRENNATIEQAKGMLMLMYGIEADRAFDVLRWRSQQENRKLRDICAGLVRSVAARAQMPEQVRREFDLVLLNPFNE